MRIPADVLDLEVRGRNLARGTLRDQISDETVLFAFLRHLG